MPAPIVAAVAQGARVAAQTTARVGAKVGQQTAKMGAKVGARTARAGTRVAARFARQGGKQAVKATTRGATRGATRAGRTATSRSGNSLGRFRSQFRTKGKKGGKSLKDRARQRLKDEARQSGGGDDDSAGSGRRRPRSKVGRARAVLAGAGQQASRQASQALTGDDRSRSYSDGDRAVAKAAGTAGRLGTKGTRGAGRLAMLAPKAAILPLRVLINKFRIKYRIKRARRRFRRVVVLVAVLLLFLLLAPLAFMSDRSEDEAWAALLPALICQDIEDGNITLTGSGNGTGGGSAVPAGDPVTGLPDDFDVEAAMGAFLVVETTWVGGEPNWDNAEGSYWGAYQFSDTEWEEDGDPRYLPLDPNNLPPPEAQHDYARTRITRLLRHYLDLYDGEVPWDVIVPVVWMPGQGWISRLRGSEIDEGAWLDTSGPNPANRNYRQLWLNAYDQIRSGQNPTHSSIAPPSGSYMDDHPEYTPVGESYGTASGGGGDGAGIDVSGGASGDLSSCASGAAPGAAAQWAGGPLGTTGRYSEGGLYSGLQTMLDDTIPQFGNQGIHCIRSGDPGAHGSNRACDLPAMPECCWNGAVPDRGEENWGHALARYLVANADRLNIDCVIWWGRIWNSTRDPGTDRDWFQQRSYGTQYAGDGPGEGRDHFTSVYTTTQGHYDHVHVSVRPRVGGRC